MRKWLSEWAPIDVLLLGAGVSLCLSFLYYRWHHPTDAFPGWELWPEGAVGLLVAWLSVRIIDRLLKRREQRGSVPARTRGNVIYMFNRIIRGLPPQFYQSRIDDLDAEVRYFAERFPKRKSFISKDEEIQISNAFEKEQAIGRESKEFSNLREKVKETALAIEVTIAHVNSERVEVSSYLRPYGQKQILADEQERLLTLLDRHASAFSRREAEGIKGCIQRPTSEGHDVGRTIDKLTRPVYGHEMKWLDQVQAVSRRIEDRKEYRHSETEKILASPEVHLGIEEMPLQLAHLAQGYVKSVGSLSALRDSIDNRIRILEPAIDNLLRAAWSDQEP